MSRRRFLKFSLAASIGSAVPLGKALAQGSFPNRPLVIVVPWPAGGGTDITTRAIAEALSKELGQPVQVENRAGASGAIGLAHASKVPADGYTLAVATADTHSINPHLRTDLPYDAINGFIPLVVYGTSYWAWMARQDFPANNMKELAALAKAKPGQITYASWGIGSTAHIAGALLESAAGLQLNHVPFPGSAPASTAIQGGHVDLMPSNRMNAESMRKAGKVKIFATSSPTRFTGVASDVPTLAEQGVTGGEAGSWYGITVRRDVPEPIVRRLREALVTVVGLPHVAAKIAGPMDPVNLHGPALDEFLRNQYERYGAVIRQKQIKVA